MGNSNQRNNQEGGMNKNGNVLMQDPCFPALGELPYAQAYDTTDRMRWRIRLAIINSGIVANDASYNLFERKAA